MGWEVYLFYLFFIFFVILFADMLEGCKEDQKPKRRCDKGFTTREGSVIGGTSKVFLLFPPSNISSCSSFFLYFFSPSFILFSFLFFL